MVLWIEELRNRGLSVTNPQAFLASRWSALGRCGEASSAFRGLTRAANHRRGIGLNARFGTSRHVIFLQPRASSLVALWQQRRGISPAASRGVLLIAIARRHPYTRHRSS